MEEEAFSEEFRQELFSEIEKKLEDLKAETDPNEFNVLARIIAGRMAMIVVVNSGLNELPVQSPAMWLAETAGMMLATEIDSYTSYRAEQARNN